METVDIVMQLDNSNDVFTFLIFFSDEKNECYSFVQKKIKQQSLRGLQ